MRAEEHVITWFELEKMLASFENAVNSDDVEQLRVLLRQAVSGFIPQCGIEDVIWKADNGAVQIAN